MGSWVQGARSPFPRGALLTAGERRDRRRTPLGVLDRAFPCVLSGITGRLGGGGGQGGGQEGGQEEGLAGFSDPAVVS